MKNITKPVSLKQKTEVRVKYPGDKTKKKKKRQKRTNVIVVHKNDESDKYQIAITAHTKKITVLKKC